MKKVGILAIVLGLGVVSCKDCHECHYEDASGQEVELGEYCDDALKDLESNGYTDGDGNNYEVHCHEH